MDARFVDLEAATSVACQKYQARLAGMRSAAQQRAAAGMEFTLQNLQRACPPRDRARVLQGSLLGFWA